MQLYINTPGTVIRQKDECFRLKNEDKFCDISPLNGYGVTLYKILMALCIRMLINTRT